MSSNYQSGHAPTETDESNAILYATMNQRRNICLSDPVNYVWKDDPVVGYVCPEGLTCYSGRCEFSKQGCQAYSNFPVFDCKRKAVPCSFGNGTCMVCDWDIEPSGVAGNPCPVVGQPELTDADAAALGANAVNCRPGDVKLLPAGTYDPTPQPDPCRPVQSFACPGLPNTDQPYLMNGQKVPCNCSDDCTSNGLGGECFIESDTGPVALPSTSTCKDTPSKPAYCYEPTRPYTEWREGFTEFSGAPAEDACVINFSQARVWCEMPWTRHTTMSADGVNPEPACWKTNYVKPYYYNEANGKCYITKSYCDNLRGNGGYDGSFGDQHNFAMFSKCEYPQGTNNEIQEGYDCCTDLGQSFAQFFFGQSIPAEFDNLRQYASVEFSGQQADTYCSSAGAETNNPVKAALDPIISFISDERLKEDIQLLEENACGLGIHLYQYKWSDLAKRLYKKPDGVMQGLLMKELEPVFPQCVRWSPYGHKMFAHVPELMPKYPDFKSVVYILVMMYLTKSSDVQQEKDKA